MSARISTHTIFTDEECLKKALDSVGTKYHVENNIIYTDRIDWYGEQHFVKEGERYVFVHEQGFPVFYEGDLSEWQDVSTYLNNVSEGYKKYYQIKIRRLSEEERKREIERKKQIVEEKKQQIIKDAKAKGYTVKEKKNGNKIQLVLVRVSR